jgi:hypothetical protein
MLSVGFGAVMAAAAGALAAIDLRYADDRARAQRARQTAIVCGDILVLVGGAWGMHALNLTEQAPRLHGAVLGILPVAVGILGGYLAARWFVEDRAQGRSNGLHGVTGIAALLVAVAATGIGRESAVALGLAAAGVLGVVWTVVPFLGSRGLRWIRFGSALTLLWVGSFGLYLMVLPAQVVVANAEPASGAELASVTGWAVTGLLLLALAAGFVKPRRGSRT